MRFVPTTPFRFASPSGKSVDFDVSRRRGVSAPFVHSTTAFARWETSRRSAS
jgi:hypothetical protein